MCGSILRALYTILLGNPQLGHVDAVAEPKTRFKAWWKLVGSAIEHAATLGQFPGDPPLSFAALFDAREEDDEEGSTVAAVLEALRNQWPPGTKFMSSDVADYRASKILDDEQAGCLGEFCALPHSTTCSVKSVGKKLGTIVDTPTRTERGVLTPCVDPIHDLEPDSKATNARVV